MSNAPGPNGVILTDPFHGTVWLNASRALSGSEVILVVSIQRSWDIEVLIALTAATGLADAIGGRELHIVTGETVDGATAVVVAQGDRLAITVLENRISDVLILGDRAHAIGDRLRAAVSERL